MKGIYYPIGLVLQGGALFFLGFYLVDVVLHYYYVEEGIEIMLRSRALLSAAILSIVAAILLIVDRDQGGAKFLVHVAIALFGAGLALAVTSLIINNVGELSIQYAINPFRGEVGVTGGLVFIAIAVNIARSKRFY